MNKKLVKFSDQNVNVRVVLAFLWGCAMFMYIYADIKTFFRPGIIEQVINKEVIGITITQGFLFAGAILMSIPPFMIFLSLVLKPKLNRVLNIVISGLHIVLMCTLYLIPDEIWWYYLFYNFTEMVFHILIIWFAVKWPNENKN